MQSAKLKFQIQNFIYSVVGEVYPDVDLDIDDVVIEHPREESHGDYATTIAMRISKILSSSHRKGGARISPIEIATKLGDAIEKRILASEAKALDHTTYRNDQKRSFRESRITNHESRMRGFDIASSIQKVTVAKPGFINLFLHPKFLISQMSRVLMEEILDGESNKTIVATGLPLENSKIMVEFTDPNPFKEFHIGHLYSNCVGETLCRVLEACGAIVSRADYFGDVGMHVAKSLYGILQAQSSKRKAQNHSEKLKTFLADLEKKTLKDRVKFLGQAYAMGSTVYKEDKKAQEEIKRVNFLVYIAAQRRLEKEEGHKPQVDYKKLIGDIDEKELAMIQLLFETGRRWSMDYFEKQYRRLDTGYLSQKEKGAKAFDFYYPESQVGEYGYKLVKDYLKKGVFEESDGAVVFRGDKHGLHTRVFINSLGLPTYEAKELGLAPTKYKDFPYDRSIIITGNEIKEYFRVLLEALRQIEPELAEKTTHIPHGMVRLPTGKMSSRTGEIITGESLLDEARKRIQNSEFRVKNEKGEDSVIPDKLAEQIGIGAVKYALLKNNIGSDISFDFKESLSFEGNSGPYLQYTFARCRSVLRRAEVDPSIAVRLTGSRSTQDDKFDLKSLSNLSNSKNYQLPDTSYQLNSEERAVLRTLYKFPEVVAEAADNYSPHVVCTFLYELAGRFNTFYNRHSILGIGKSDKDPSTASRRTGSKLAQDDKFDLKSLSNLSNSKSKEQATNYQLLTTNFRLALTQAVAQVIKNGLFLLGIEAPRKM